MTYVLDSNEWREIVCAIFAGWELTGWPIVTIRRGEVVYEGGKILAAAGSGQLAPRQHWQRP
jgi:hypothetical protein